MKAEQAVSAPADKNDPFTSRQATLTNFEFDAKLLTTDSWAASYAIDDYLLYTIGHLNGENSVGRLDKVEISNQSTRTLAGGDTELSFHVKLPVAWGKSAQIPATFEFVLPTRGDAAGYEAFTTKYKSSCVDHSAHDVDSGSMWYYYRPRVSGCKIDAADKYVTTATVTRSTENTSGKYPEFHKIWEDKALDIVAIFGKYEDGATTDADAGVAAFNAFANRARSLAANMTTTPANLNAAPGVDHPDVTFSATLSDGRKLNITALLVDNVRTAPPAFDTRYNELSKTADMIFYNGHAGLGSNVRALVRKGTFVAGKYQIFFMNGCDTFAYVDGALAQTKAALNPDDPNGTKYLDFVTNAMPSYFHENPNAVATFVTALLNVAKPKTYQEIFANIDTDQVVVATGEEDNVYFPGYVDGGVTPPPAGDWKGQTETGAVAKNAVKDYVTPELPAGRYSVTLSETGAQAGDADLYVRVGSAPTLKLYDCRPYTETSNENCSITLAVPGKIYVQVRGYAASASAYKLVISGAATQPTKWSGLSASGTLKSGEEYKATTGQLTAGEYVFSLTETGATAGDADLYVRVGSEPTATTYDCRPYDDTSNETCTIKLTAPATVYVLVSGYAASSSYALTGAQK